MPHKTLPNHPSLLHLKSQARDLQKALRLQEPQAFQRVREFHPSHQGDSDDLLRTASLSLADSQLVIAREYCFASWTKLKEYVESPPNELAKLPHHERIADPVFRLAVELLDSGDESGLRQHLSNHPEVVRQRVFFDIGDYFGQPTLLEFVAENPIRHGKLPPNAVAMAKIVLDAGGGKNRDSLNRSLEWVSSGSVARISGTQIALIALLCGHGANPDSALGAAIGHGEFEAVEALLRHGARLDLPVAAALGRDLDVGRLLSDAGPEARHRALAYACQFGRASVVRLLLEVGENPNRFNPVGCHSHSTPLHQAALAGQNEVVRLLLEFGADPTVKDTLWGGTPADWARHGGHEGELELA